LTAYALGEMTKVERKAFETELESSTECRREVEEIGRVTTQLSTKVIRKRNCSLSTRSLKLLEAAAVCFDGMLLSKS